MSDEVKETREQMLTRHAHELEAERHGIRFEEAEADAAGAKILSATRGHGGGVEYSVAVELPAGVPPSSKHMRAFLVHSVMRPVRWRHRDELATLEAEASAPASEPSTPLPPGDEG